MKSKYLFRLFLVTNIVVIFLTIVLLVKTVSLKRSTPFVDDILFYKVPLIDGKVPSVVLAELLFFTITPTSLIGCAVKLDRFFYATHKFFDNAIYAFQFVLGIGMYSMQHLADSRSDLELELVESVMQFDEKFNIDDALKWEATHIHLKCCGFDDFRDWFLTPNGNRTDVPDSCCIIYTNKCGHNAFYFNSVEEKLYIKGCYPIISRRIEEIRLLYLGIVFILLVMPIAKFITAVRSWIITKQRHRS